MFDLFMFGKWIWWRYLVLHMEPYTIIFVCTETSMSTVWTMHRSFLNTGDEMDEVCTDPEDQIASPNTDTIQYMVLFSHLTVQLPSVWLSQKQELAVWRPAPFFCIITHVTMYLKGFPSFVSWFRHCSTTLEVHWLTLLCW